MYVLSSHLRWIPVYAFGLMWAHQLELRGSKLNTHFSNSIRGITAENSETKITFSTAQHVQFQHLVRRFSSFSVHFADSRIHGFLTPLLCFHSSFHFVISQLCSSTWRTRTRFSHSFVFFAFIDKFLSHVPIRACILSACLSFLRLSSCFLSFLSPPETGSNRHRVLQFPCLFLPARIFMKG